MQHPILCRAVEDKFEVISGLRCVEAHRLLGKDWIEAIVVDDDLSDDELVVRKLICNTQREGLNPIDQARAIRSIMNKSSLSAADVARRLEESPSSTSRGLSLLSLSEELQQLVADGSIPASAGYELSKVKDPQAQATLAAQVVTRSMTRDELAREVRHQSRRPKQRPDRTPRVTAELGDGRSVTVVGKALTLDALIEWLEPLITRAKKAKAQGLSLETFVRAMRDQARSEDAA